MRLTTILKNETVTKIANRLYPNLTDDSRKTAESAILKLNPALSNSSGLKAGVIIKVPELSTLKLDLEQISEDPIAQKKAIIKESLRTYKTQLNERIGNSLS